jgi:very-short-patch-repair endonuclease
MSKEWPLAKKTGRLPIDIPGQPARVYKDKGWAGWGDFLGTTPHGTSMIEIALRHELSKVFLVHQGVKRIPLDKGKNKRVDIFLIEKNVVIEYDGAYYHSKSLQKDTKETLLMEKAGCVVIRIREQSKKYNLPLINEHLDLAVDWQPLYKTTIEQVFDHLILLGLTTDKERALICRYKTEHREAYRDFFVSPGFWPYEFAREFVQKLQLKNKRAWSDFTQTDEFSALGRLPASPESSYGPTFTTWGDFLGTGNIANRDKTFMSLEDAKAQIRLIVPRISSEVAWRKANREGRMPASIPKNPKVYYANEGWIGWGDFLSNGQPPKNLGPFLDYEVAKAFISKLVPRVKNVADFRQAILDGLITNKIPRNPHHHYSKGKGWISYGDFLGTNRVANANKSFVTYEMAVTLIRQVVPPILISKEFRHARKTNEILSGLPRNPDNYYREEWKGWGEFLGVGNRGDGKIT